MKQRLGLMIALMFSGAFLHAVALPNFIQNDMMHEQTRSYVWGGDVNVHINAPGKDSLKLNKETVIVFYACPAGNTIPWTVGKQLEGGDDWHYDIQHIGAQTRFLRHTLKDKNLITIYVQPTNNAWNLYDDNHPTDYVNLIQSMVQSILAPFSEFDYKVTLNGHSAGGSWVLRYLLGVTEVPGWIDRIAFLDSDYNYKYDADHYDAVFKKFVLDRDSTYMCVIAYNDSVALYQGSPVVSAQGGTWWNTRYMKSRLDPFFTFVDSHDVDFQRHIALNKRFEILLKENPTQAILHTVQIYKNGFIHSMLSGTEYENVGYDYYGEPAYMEYIQGNPTARPKGVSAFPGWGAIDLNFDPVEGASGYRVYYSDGENMIDTVTISDDSQSLLGRNVWIDYIRVTAINEWGESAPSDWLAVTPSDIGSSYMIMVNAVNREPGNDYLIRHAQALKDSWILIGSCTNDMIISGEVELSESADMVDYIIGNEDRLHYPLSPEEIAQIKSYLQAGGNLFLSGSEIAYDLHYKGDSSEVDFCENFLKLQCVSDRPNNEGSTYYDAVINGLDTSLAFQFDNGNFGTYNVVDPDGILPVNGGYQSAYFPGYDAQISGAGVAYSGLFPGGTRPGRVSTLSIPFETIVGDTMRQLVMNEVVDFLRNCGTDAEPVMIPETTVLLAPYPNPFNPATMIRCQLSEASELDLSVYNLKGQKVITLFNGDKAAGNYSFQWNAQSFPSGIYLVVMSVDGRLFESKKMALVK